MQLEQIQLLEAVNSFHLEELSRLGTEESEVQEELSFLSYFLEKFSSLELLGQKERKEELALDDELQEKIQLFKDAYWPKIVARHQGSIPEHRNPFPDYADKSTVRLSDISSIKGRLEFVASRESHIFASHSRSYQRVANNDYHCTNMMSYSLVTDPCRTIVRNQRVQ